MKIDSGRCPSGVHHPDNRPGATAAGLLPYPAVCTPRACFRTRGPASVPAGLLPYPRACFRTRGPASVPAGLLPCVDSIQRLRTATRGGTLLTVNVRGEIGFCTRLHTLQPYMHGDTRLHAAICRARGVAGPVSGAGRARARRPAPVCHWSVIMAIGYGWSKGALLRVEAEQAA
jgi:hypothetical protein